MLQAVGVMVLTRCLLFFLVALQAQDAQSVPMQGQGPDVAKGRGLLAPEPDSILIPSWYLKGMNSHKFREELSEAHPEVPEDVQTDLEEAPSGSATLEKAETAGYQEPGKNYILGTAAAFGVLLLGIVVCCTVMSRLRRKDTDKDEAESEGAGRGKRAQTNTKLNSCRLSPGIFAAELAQLYRNMGTDPAPLPACPSCSLADGASSQENWVSLDSLQPTPSWCPCYQYQQGYFSSEDDDC